MKIYEALKQIEPGGEYAICSKVCEIIKCQNTWETWYWHKEYAFIAWSKFSGCKVFPVPYKYFGIFPSDPQKAYFKLEKWTGRYGRDRKELLEHLISWFEERNL